MKPRNFFALVLTLLSLVALIAIQANAGQINARAAIDQVRGANAVMTSGTLSLGVLLIWGLCMVLIFFGRVRNFMLVLALVAVTGVVSACSGGARYATTNPRDVVFVVNLRAPANQATVTSQVQTVEGDVKDPEFWQSKQQKVNVQAIPIPIEKKQTGPGVFGSSFLAGTDDFPSVIVITVPSTPVTVQWAAPAIVCEQPLPDMSVAFSMQSLEDQGGSTGVYTGAVVTAVIEDPALYLSIYGYEAENQQTHTHPAYPLETVIKTEMYGYIQQQLAMEYGQRSVLQQNRDMNIMYPAIEGRLIEKFKPKGILVTSFYNRDGNIYENCDIQGQADDQIKRQSAYLDAYATATLKAIDSMGVIEQAYALATATMIAAQSAAQAQDLQAKTLRENPDIVALEYARRWNGQLPQIMGGGNNAVPVPMIPFTIQGTPLPTATAAPAQ